MPARSRSKSKVDSNKNAKSSKKSKAVAVESAASKIAEIAEAKHESDHEEEEEFDEHFKSEHYLKLNKKVSRAAFTSIDCLSWNELQPLKRKAIANRVNAKHKEAYLMKVRREQYRKWLIELKSGFNLLFYGVGSKKQMLEDFGKLYLCHDDKGIVISVNGYLEDVSMKHILNSLSAVIIDRDKAKRAKKNALKTDKDAIQRAVNIVHYLESKNAKNTEDDALKYKYYYLMLHNIAGKALRKKESQRILSILAHCKYIHVVASMDHLHSLLLWDRNDLAMFHWIYHEVSTYQHYVHEMEFEREATIQMQDGDESGNHGLQHIMSSLTDQHRDIIQILAEAQLENNDGVGLTHSEWYRLCEDAMCCTNTLKFEQYIGEFKDHNVIRQDSARDIVYTIPYSKQVIQKHLIDF
eukprot:CAMPEP_0197033466 /NCGR_PEP_ID=MMETSP1384-20130603/11860_1 /TAXON_ID=29189 /ORGANISM="Ammonia sp." /LENGTH=409 /DNA_ID=CAMNT_0042463273 /DNA_START=22 /DNA_END=1251 /DNA_ORIENTATION=-